MRQVWMFVKKNYALCRRFTYFQYVKLKMLFQSNFQARFTKYSQVYSQTPNKPYTVSKYNNGVKQKFQ